MCIIVEKNEYLCLIFTNERDMLAYRKIVELKVAGEYLP